MEYSMEYLETFKRKELKVIREVQRLITRGKQVKDIDLTTILKKFCSNDMQIKWLKYDLDSLATCAPNAVMAIRQKAHEEEYEKICEKEYEKIRKIEIKNIHKKLGYDAKQIATLFPSNSIEYIQSVIDKLEKKNKVRSQ